MHRVAVALLSCAYIICALVLAALFWRMGAGWPMELCGFLGVASAAFTVHNLIGRSLDSAALRSELATLRAAHRILADHIEATQEAMASLTQTVQSETTERTDAIVSEVRMLEDLVARMGETLQARIDAKSAPGPGGRGGPAFDRQRGVLLDTVRQALAEGRVDLYLQPVVSLPQRRTAYYESFSRLRDDSGRVMMPAEYLSVAEPEGLMSAIDNLLLFRCVQIVRRMANQDRRIGIFCNISPASLGDEDFFPQFLDFLGQNRDLSGALIFRAWSKGVPGSQFAAGAPHGQAGRSWVPVLHRQGGRCGPRLRRPVPGRRALRQDRRQAPSGRDDGDARRVGDGLDAGHPGRRLCVAYPPLRRRSDRREGRGRARGDRRA